MERFLTIICYLLASVVIALSVYAVVYAISHLRNEDKDDVIIEQQQLQW